MNMSATILLSIIVFCLGAAIGSLIESGLKKRSTARPPTPLLNNNLAGSGDVQIFSAWRTQENRVWLDMDGQRLENQEALQPSQRQRLLNLILDLRPWLETGRPVEPVSGMVAQTVQLPIKKSPPVEEKVEPVPIPESIIYQIDKVLQVKLASSGFKDRGIRLIEGPGGIVLIEDGTNKYEGIDSVPDLQVKTLIQQAVADWEKGIR
jgi:hypothetical protein